jgi:hypothetical protein
MRTGYLYRPPNTTSICAEILKYFPIPENQKAAVKLRWYRCNKAGKVLYDMAIEERFKMPQEYWKTWTKMGVNG